MGGFANVLHPSLLIYAVIGCVLGNLVGVLPGIGPAAGTAILIPITAGLDPTGSIIMLASIYYGAIYGGTITSVLLNTPGEPSSAVTCLDGYPMARAGRAGPALAIAAIGSFFGGTVATMGLVMLALPLTKVALTFGPPEVFALLVIGLTMVTGLASKSVLRALIAAIIGLLLAQIGTDPVMGAQRFTFGQLHLMDGLSIVAVVMGLFGIGEILRNVEMRSSSVFAGKVGRLFLSKTDIRRSVGPIGRGTVIGFFLGLIPGLGSMIPAFLAYSVEKRISRKPEDFGKGVIEGVAAPESANNAYANAALIPLFTLGIPSSPTIAVLMGAFMMNGLIPGPSLFIEHPAFVWSVIASLVVGNAILLILNLPFIPVWVTLLKIPYSILITFVLAFCVIGIYSLNNSVFDIYVMIFFGIVGYLFKKLDIPAAPLVLTLILGPMMEQGLRQSLEISGGDPTIFFTRPISATLLVLAGAIIVLSTFRALAPVRGSSNED